MGTGKGSGAGNPVQEGRYTKVGVLVAAIGVILVYLGWQYPKAPRVDAKDLAPVEVTTPTTVRTPKTTETPLMTSSPEPHLPSRPSCESPEVITLRANSPSRAAAGLVTLSITAGQMGTEKYLTLGINSDRESRVETVLAAPSRTPYRFKTSAGNYFLNVIQVDFETSSMTVQMGCVPKGTMP